ncbi:MAG: hypothetical protein ACTSV2_00050, partial [Candidatus Thorarchaeota archaeon]
MSQADTILMIIDGQHRAEALTINEIANEVGVTWSTTNHMLSIIFDIQNFIAAYELDIVGSRPKNVVFLWPRVDIGKLPLSVAEWFVNSSFFTTSKAEHTTEEALKLLAFKRMKKTPINEGIRRVISVLQLQDQLSVSELSRRAVLNRRTVENVLNLIQNIQDTLCKFKLRKVEDMIMIDDRPDIYTLDETRMKILLTKRY